jgi:hypothetical protein
MFIELFRHYKMGKGTFRWFIPILCDYNISIDKVGKSNGPRSLIDHPPDVVYS